jgi:hypothetical protein
MGARPQRHSARLAAKAPELFEDMTGKASQRKALINSLEGCSAALKKQVNKRNILSRNKLPVGVKDLRKLVTVAGLSCGNDVADDVVLQESV